MRRYAFESFVTHFIWFLLIFSFTNGFAMPFASWLESFYQWDARWYGTIAQDGHGFLPQTYVFPPVHGWILGLLTDCATWLAGFFTAKPVWVNLFYYVVLANGICMFTLANTLFVFISERRWNIDRRTLWIAAASNPMGYFALTAYSDMLYFALFLAIMILVLWTNDRRAQWRLPNLTTRQDLTVRISLAVLLFTAPWVRLTGFSFAALSLLRRKEAIAVFVSLVTFLGYYWIRTKDPFFFLLAQQVFGMPKGGFLDGLMTSTSIVGLSIFGDIPRGGDARLYVLNFGLLPTACLSLTIGFSYWLLKKREFEWASVIIAMTLLSHNQAFWRSTVRYALPLFPLFLWMILDGHRKLTRRQELLRKIAMGVAIGLGFSLQIFYGRLFQAGGWAF